MSVKTLKSYVGCYTSLAYTSTVVASPTDQKCHLLILPTGRLQTQFLTSWMLTFKWLLCTYRNEMKIVFDEFINVGNTF